MVSSSLALLYFLLSFHGGRQGSSPDRGQSPVEWEDFLFVCLSVRPSVHSPLWAIQPGLRPSQPASQASEGGTNGQTNGRKISPFYRTLSPIGVAALPPPRKTKEKVEQGKGTADQLMPLGYLFLLTTVRTFFSENGTGQNYSLG